MIFLAFQTRNAARLSFFALFPVLALALVRADDALAPGAPAPPSVPSAAEVLATLKKEHPRLILTPSSVADLKSRLNSDEQFKSWYPKIVAEGDKLLGMPPVTFVATTDLNSTRQVEDRIRTLSFLYQMTGDKKYSDRGWQELDAAAHWPEWSPQNTLVMGEMTCAVAIGYDWLYPALTSDQRTELEQAIVTKGLNPAIASPWWTHVNYNWNQVCSGGVGLGALAVADVQQDVAVKALQVSLTALPAVMASYAPDGGWREGPTYWNYGTTFGVYFIASLQTATGTDANFTKYPGFSRTGLYALAMTGPTNLPFNFADSEPIPPDGPFLFWLANQFDLPSCVDYQRQHAKPSALDLVWYRSNLPPAAPIPTNLYFSRAAVMTMRGSWTDNKTSYVGFKGGDNNFNHSHLDLGSFVFDANGCRFAQMLSSESYGRPGYFDLADKRWTYYRARAEGANTLVINPGPGPDQDPKATAPMIKTKLDGDHPFAIADLTAAYAKDVSSVHRGIALIGGRQLLVQDEIQAPKPAEVWWFMHTKATIDRSSQSPDGRTITLSGVDPTQIQNIECKAQILSPPGARFDVMAATPLPGTNPAPAQNGNTDFQKLAIHLKDVTNITLIVTLTPVTSDTTSLAAPQVTPLDQW